MVAVFDACKNFLKLRLRDGWPALLRLIHDWHPGEIVVPHSRINLVAFSFTAEATTIFRTRV